MVREFYGMLSRLEEDATMVMVRGVPIKFSPAMINRYFGLPHGEETAVDCLTQSTNMTYRLSCRHMFHDDELILGWPEKLGSKQMKNKYYLWLCFSSIFFHPTTNMSEVQAPRYTMLMMIESEEFINVGEHIWYKMIGCANGSKRLPMPYPCLITALCLRAGVSANPWDVTGPQEPPFTITSMRRSSSISASQPTGPSISKRARVETINLDSDMPEEHTPVLQDFLPTHQDTMDYAFANTQWHMYDGINRMMANMDLALGRSEPTPPIQFHYHRHPMQGYYAMSPQSFAATSTDYIPAFHAQFFRNNTPYPTYYGQPTGSQFAGIP